MRNFRGITYKITGVMFVLVMMNVFFLTSYARQRVEGLFHDYLAAQNIHGGVLGKTEQQFLFSFHESLVWVGVVCTVIGLLLSYWLARSITIPLRKLNAAVINMENGNLEEKAEVTSRDEIGHLAEAFNRVTQALAVNQRLRKRLLADIAHELNTPLTVIEGNLEGMLCGFVHRDDKQISSLYEEVEHLSKLIGDLRELSLAEAGQLELCKEATDMNMLISRIVEMMKPLADAKDQQILFGAKPMPIIHVDCNRIHQVFHNLLTNAFRYSPQGGAITITAKAIGQEDNQWLQIDICDAGSGIAETDLPHIFERFYRTSRARDRKSGGSGIGLSIVKQLIELHGGRITVKSSLGEGSTFTVYLPVTNIEKASLI